MRRILLVAIAVLLSTVQAHAQRSCSDFTLDANQQIAACTAMISAPTNAGSAKTAVRSADTIRYNLFLNRGAAYARTGDAEKSRADFRRAIELTNQALADGGPPLPDEYNRRCWARAVANVELELALADCDEAIRLLPRRSHVLDSRGLVYLRLGRLEDALRDYEAALRISPRLAGSLYGRAIARVRMGNLEDARSDVFLAETLAPGTQVRFQSFGFKD